MCNIFLKELRAWRHRFWWLPMGGALCVILPMALASPPQMPSPELLQQQTWLQSQVTFSTIPAEWLAVVTFALGTGASGLASWLAYTLRWSEIHNNTLTDLALTRVTALEIVAGQILAIWAITSVALAGAAPILIYYATMAGRSETQILTGVAVLMFYPLLAAATGYGSMWWKRLATASVRGKSYLRFMVVVTLLLTMLCAAVGLPLAYPLNLWAYGTLLQNDDLLMRIDLFMKSLFWGTPIVCLLWLAFVALRALWQWRMWGRIVALLLLLLFMGGGCVGARSASGWIASLSAQMGQWAPFPRGDPVLLFGLGLMPLGAARAFGGQWEGTEFMNALDPHLLTGIGLGLAYLVIIALASFVFAVGDVKWTMQNGWAIATLQNPTRAALLLPEAARAPRRRVRRAVSYLFVTRNPFYDFFLTRSVFSRVTFTGIFGFIVIVFTGGLAHVWADYLKAPTEHWRLGSAFLLVTMLMAILCASQGLACGSHIAQLKERQQWSGLLVTPTRLRALLLGVCLPTCGDSLMLCLLFSPLVFIGRTLGVVQWSNVGVALLLFLLMPLICGVTAIFSSAFTKTAAKAGLLSVILTGVLLAGVLFLLTYLESFFPFNRYSLTFMARWHFGNVEWLESLYPPLSPYPPQWWEIWLPKMVALVALIGACLSLLWLACRRLRWER